MPDYQKFGINPESVKTDRLTGLPVESDEIRTALAKQLSECIKSGKGFACFYSDLDQLKTVNTRFGRKKGDMYLTWGADVVQKGLQSVIDANRTEVFPYKFAHTADEVGVWLFDVTPEDVERIKMVAHGLNEEARDDINHTPIFSVSNAFISSHDPEIAPLLPFEKRRLSEDEEALTYDVFNKILSLGDKRTMEIKDAKNDRKYNSIVFSNELSDEQKSQAIEDEFSDIRIGKELFKKICKFNRDMGRREGEDLKIPESRIQTVYRASSS
jgi:GGDEF domain-containing protein